MHKSAFIMSGVVLVAVLGIIFLHGRSMSPAVKTAGIPVSFTELAHGAHSEVTRRTNYVVTSATQLSTLWKMIDSTVERPNVDFTREVVVAVFMGTAPSLGYSATVTHVTDTESRLVTVTLSKPGGSCIVGESLTHPYQIIVLPKTSLSFGHQDQSATVSCLQ